MSEIVIETENLTKEYVRDEFHVLALKDVSLRVAKGEFIALMGPSGSSDGKITKINCRASRAKSVGRSCGESALNRKAYIARQAIGIDEHRRWDDAGRGVCGSLILNRNGSGNRVKGEYVFVALCDGQMPRIAQHHQSRVIGRIHVRLTHQGHHCNEADTRHRQTDGDDDHQLQ